MVDTASMPGLLTKRRRAIAATSLLAALVVMATTLSPASAAALRLLADALPSGHPSCHARVFDAAERAARDLAAERKWGALEQFDGTPRIESIEMARHSE